MRVKGCKVPAIGKHLCVINSFFEKRLTVQHVHTCPIAIHIAPLHLDAVKYRLERAQIAIIMSV